MSAFQWIDVALVLCLLGILLGGGLVWGWAW